MRPRFPQPPPGERPPSVSNRRLSRSVVPARPLARTFAAALALAPLLMAPPALEASAMPPAKSPRTCAEGGRGWCCQRRERARTAVRDARGSARSAAQRTAPRSASTHTQTHRRPEVVLGQSLDVKPGNRAAPSGVSAAGTSRCGRARPPARSYHPSLPPRAHAHTSPPPPPPPLGDREA